MTAKTRSAGLLMFKRTGDGVRMLLVHPGGPFWKNKDAHDWSIPKGEYAEGSDPRACAMREFEEELGVAPPEPRLALGEIRQAGGKTVTAWAVEGDFDPATLRSNTFEIEWPPKSGRRQSFPEVDRAQWFSPDDARVKINAAQAAFIDRLLAAIDATSASGRPPG